MVVTRVSHSCEFFPHEGRSLAFSADARYTTQSRPNACRFFLLVFDFPMKTQTYLARVTQSLWKERRSRTAQLLAIDTK